MAIFCKAHIHTKGQATGVPRVGSLVFVLGAGSELTSVFFLIVKLYNNININKQLMVAPGGW